MDAAAAKAFNDLTNRINELAFSIAVAIKQFDDEVPENLAAIQKELRVNLREVFEELNRVRAKEGLAPLKVVIGYTSGGDPIYE